METVRTVARHRHEKDRRSDVADQSGQEAHRGKGKDAMTVYPEGTWLEFTRDGKGGVRFAVLHDGPPNWKPAKGDSDRPGTSARLMTAAEREMTFEQLRDYFKGGNLSVAELQPAVVMNSEEGC